MRSETEQAANWKDGAGYAPLLEADRAIFAWEWLRRDPSYRAAAARSLRHSGSYGSCRDALAWGLHAFEPPHLAAPVARPVWRRAVCPYVLGADAMIEGQHEDRFDLARLKPFATLVIDPVGTEHLLLSDGLHALRVDVLAGTIRGGPILLHYRLSGLTRVGESLIALRQLLALWRAGEFSRALHAPERRARRWILALRTHDALLADASQREIAERLLSPEAAESRWRVRAPALRSQVQRLVREARAMAGGGYRLLLRG